ncbi:MAG: type I-C CRISPR-associated protein Cas8c/Csd1, partial [Oscillospiraceae bacterium]|nr:type I-C CRISPR-associated protein Cas8c/Csd1 [Oscillospiraceae bacterium]
MSLFTSLLETYEKCKDATGIIQYNDKGEADERKTLLPIFHTTFKSQICVTLDNKGDFIKAERDNRDVTIIIPCTESSSGRSSGISAHPLCDQLDYVGGINSDKTLVYLKGLSEWIECASGSAKTKLNAIYTYVSSGAMIFDLENRDLFRESEYDDDGGSKALNNEKIRKVGVRFAVRVDGDKEPNIWEDKELRQSWIDYIKLQNDSDYDAFDYISGERVGKIASQHPKNVNAMTGNAKLLSCNDTSGFTFRGRFSNQEDAVLIDYEQSQKVHQMLRWLISNYGYNI